VIQWTVAKFEKYIKVKVFISKMVAIILVDIGWVGFEDVVNFFIPFGCIFK